MIKRIILIGLLLLFFGLFLIILWQATFELSPLPMLVPGQWLGPAFEPTILLK